jgi:cytoskeleton protein RodZ
VGEVAPVPIRAGNGSNSSGCGTGSADIHEKLACVGEELRQARQRRAKSLRDVSNALKISTDYLTALEMSRFADLPSRVYAIGYVRSCAAYLGLDAKDLVARFKTELASAGIAEPDYSIRSGDELPPEEEFDASRAAKSAMIRLPSLPAKALAQAAGILVLAGVASYSLYHITASGPASVPAQLVSEAGVSDEPVAQPLAAEVPRNLHLAEPPLLHEVPLQLPLIDLQLVAIDEPRILKFAAPVPSDSTKLVSPHSEPVRTAVQKQPGINTSRKIPVIQSDVAALAQRVSLSNEARASHTIPHSGQHYGESTKYSRITLRLRGETAIRVLDRRNRVLIDRALDAGDTYRVPDISGLRLSALDGGAVEIILDNTTVGFAAKVGVPARGISLEPKAIYRTTASGPKTCPNARFSATSASSMVTGSPSAARLVTPNFSPRTPQGTMPLKC